MANHSGILAWRIPWTEESGRLKRLSMHTHYLGSLPDFDKINLLLLLIDQPWN